MYSRPCLWVVHSEPSREVCHRLRVVEHTLLEAKIHLGEGDEADSVGQPAIEVLLELLEHAGFGVGRGR